MQIRSPNPQTTSSISNLVPKISQSQIRQHQALQCPPPEIGPNMWLSRPQTEVGKLNQRLLLSSAPSGLSEQLFGNQEEWQYHQLFYTGAVVGITGFLSSLSRTTQSFNTPIMKGFKKQRQLVHRVLRGVGKWDSWPRV
jgi:hypothetical protein